MYRSLMSLVPTAAELLALDLEQLGGVLLRHLKSYEGVYGNTVYQNGLISQKNFADSLEAKHGQKPEYLKWRRGRSLESCCMRRHLR